MSDNKDIQIGDLTFVNGRNWRIDRIDPKYVFISWGQRKKVIPLGSAIKGLIDKQISIA